MDICTNVDSKVSPPVSPHTQNEQLSAEKALAIEAELTRLLYTRASIGFVATLINATILIVVLWSVLPTLRLLGWYFLMVVITGARFLLVYRRKQCAPTNDQEARWRAFYILGTMSSGVIWGFLCLFLFPSDLSHQVFIAFVIAGMSAGAVTILASVPLSALLFFLPTLTPLAFQFFRQGNDLGVAMGIMILVFFGALLFAVRHLYISTVETLDLRFSRLTLEHSLRTREIRYQELFENANDGIATFTLDGVLTSVNRGLERMLGRSREEMIGHHHREFATAASTTLASERTRRALAGETLPSLFELELVHKNKTVVPVEGRARLMRDRTGVPTGVQAVFRDISDRKKAEAALRESEERYRSVIASMEEGITIYDAEGVIRMYNASAERILGLSLIQQQERFCSDSRCNAVCEDGSPFPLTDHPAAETLRSGQPCSNVIMGVYKPVGGLRWLSINSHPIRQQNVKFPSGVVVSFTDITEQKRAQDALRKTHEEMEQRVEERTAELHHANRQLAAEIVERQGVEEALKKKEEYFRALIEGGSDLISILQANGVIKYASPSHARILGYDPEDLVGNDVFSLIHPDDLSRVLQAFSLEINSPGIGRPVEFRFRHKDGSWRMLESAGRNFLDLAIIDGLLINSRDISERQRAEQEKQALRAQLAQAQKLQSLGTLAGGIAHDFNNLLTPIIGFSELLKRSVAPDTVTRKNLEEILKASLRAKELVQQMLAFSRPSQQLQLPVELNTLVEDCLMLLRAGTSSSIEIQASLDPAAGQVLADPTQLHQVIMNLGVNALQALDEQGGTIAITVRQVEVDASFAALHPPLTPRRYCTVTVHDTGCGMTPEVQAHIFDPFFTTKEVGQGSGLGLSVVHGIVNSHGGAILADSAPGEGATFTVYLPCVDIPVTVTIPTPSAPPTGKGRVLMVDDERAVTSLAVQMLTDLGYDAMAVTESQEAITLLRQDPQRFDVMIADQSMPGLKGVDLALTVRALHPKLPIIICSGSQLELPSELTTVAGPTSYLQKPFTLEQLGEALHRVFQPEEEAQL